jgi:hypothetical protein
METLAGKQAVAFLSSEHVDRELCSEQDQSDSIIGENPMAVKPPVLLGDNLSSFIFKLHLRSNRPRICIRRAIIQHARAQAAPRIQPPNTSEGQ